MQQLLSDKPERRQPRGSVVFESPPPLVLPTKQKPLLSPVKMQVSVSTGRETVVEEVKISETPCEERESEQDEEENSPSAKEQALPEEDSHEVEESEEEEESQEEAQPEQPDKSFDPADLPEITKAEQDALESNQEAVGAEGRRRSRQARTAMGMQPPFLSSAMRKEEAAHKRNYFAAVRKSVGSHHCRDLERSLSPFAQFLLKS